MENKRRIKRLRAVLLLIVAVCLCQIVREWGLSVRHRSYEDKLRQALQAEEEKEEENAPDAAGRTEPGDYDTKSKEEQTPAQKYSEPQTAVAQKLGAWTEPQTTTRKEEQPAPDPGGRVLDRYSGLYALNHDMVGWLSIPGTVIDYPVVQCGDNEYYLHHNFYGEEDKYGCLFVKDVADVDTPGDNFIIYGHNMKDGSMFGELDLYRDSAFYEENPRIRFDTLYEERAYEIMAVFLSRVYGEEEEGFKYYQFYRADTEEEFLTFYQQAMDASLYKTGVTAAFGDTFLTLSTCAYHEEDGRLVIVAKRI